MCEQCGMLDDEDDLDALAQSFLLRRKAGQVALGPHDGAPARPGHAPVRVATARVPLPVSPVSGG